MLVLTRRANEKIVIGEGPDAVTITLCAIQGNKARIGIEAPKHLAVVREELLAPPPEPSVGAGPTAVRPVNPLPHPL